MALILVLGALTVLTVMLTEFQDESSAELGSAVAERDAVKAENGATTISAVVETKDNMKLQLSVLKIGENDRWVSLKVLEDGKDAKRAQELKDKVVGWQYKIADWRSRQIFKTFAEIFEEKVELPGKDKKDDASGVLPDNSSSANN